jgi:hypothetical protein
MASDPDAFPEDAEATEAEENQAAAYAKAALEDGDEVLERTSHRMVSLPGPPGTGIEVEVFFRRSVIAKPKGTGPTKPVITCEVCTVLTYPDGSTFRDCHPVPCPRKGTMMGPE